MEKLYYVKIDTLYLQDFYFDSANISDDFISKITLRVDKDFCYLCPDSKRTNMLALLQLFFHNATISFEEQI